MTSRYVSNIKLIAKKHALNKKERINDTSSIQTEASQVETNLQRAFRFGVFLHVEAAPPLLTMATRSFTQCKSKQMRIPNTRFVLFCHIIATQHNTLSPLFLLQITSFCHNSDFFASAKIYSSSNYKTISFVPSFPCSLTTADVICLRDTFCERV